ncbi:MAG: ketopantoate reductase family protein [Candidatus Rhabdochlamydia sp.]|jgi:2-dehydropantoate 2-reductase|nr:2-dehydropantoate 2-reductase [Chlamydiota bacterium]
MIQVSEMEKKNKRRFVQEQANDIFVIGAGCIGQGLVVSLLKSNISNRVFLVSKTKQLQKIQKNGITLTGVVEGRFTLSKRFVVVDKIYRDFFLKYKIAKSPIVFLTTKARDIASSLYLFQQGLSDLGSIVICLQNGLGLELEVENALNSLSTKVLKGQVFGAIYKNAESLFAYKGSILVERFSETCSERLKKIFHYQNDSVFNLEISSNILQAIYPKIAINCVCNPLTVILNQPLGSIKIQYEALIRMICNEVYRIALSQSIELSSLEDLSNNVLEAMSRFSSHYSSMYLDFQYGKVSEIEYINGAILKIAQVKKIPVPLNQLLINSIKELEKKRLSCKSVKEFYQRNDLYLENIKTQLFEMVKYNRALV